MKQPESTPQRYRAIDAIRGVAMILMVLDHTRDFLGSSSINPRDVTEAGLFLTRWITHVCAPFFIFLAGVSAWLSKRRYTDRWKASRDLLLRGLWLIGLELSVVRIGWTFELGFQFIFLQALWALGWGLIALSILMFLPTSVVGVIGAVIIVSHNLLDPIKATAFSSGGWIWNLLHEPHLFQLASGRQVWALYPLVPWIGVVAFGYGFAPNLVPQARSNRFFYAWGGGMLGLFVLLRLTGLYGDPHPWQTHPTVLATLLTFVNCEKYPPSLQFLLMTLGPMIAVYPLLSKLRGKAASILLTFGQVPLFFYVLHVPLIHLLAVVHEAWNHHSLSWLHRGFPILNKPAGYGIPLAGVYLSTLLALLILYPACRWYGSEKQGRRRWWHKLI